MPVPYHELEPDQGRSIFRKRLKLATIHISIHLALMGMIVLVFLVAPRVAPAAFGVALIGILINLVFLARARANLLTVDEEEYRRQSRYPWI